MALGLVLRPGLLVPRPTSGLEWAVLQTDSCSFRSPQKASSRARVMRGHKPGLRLDQPPQPHLSRSLSLQGHLHRRHLLHYRRAVGHGQRVHLVQPQHWRPGNNQGAALSPSSTEPHPHSCAARPAPSQSPVWPSFTLFESPCLASSPGSFVSLLSQAPPTPGTHSSRPRPWL